MDSDEEQLPIDIDYTKILPWLHRRHKIPSNYPVLLHKIHQAQHLALQHLPPTYPHPLPTPPLTYHDSQQIFDNLLHHHAEYNLTISKDFLGRYREDVLWRWDGILGMYRKGSVRLCENAGVLLEGVEGLGRGLERREGVLREGVLEGLRRRRELVRGLKGMEERVLEGLGFWGVVEGEELEGGVRREVGVRVGRVLERVGGLVGEEVVREGVEFYGGFVGFVEGEEREVCGFVKRVMSLGEEDLMKEFEEMSREGKIDKGDAGVELAAKSDWDIEVEDEGQLVPGSEDTTQNIDENVDKLDRACTENDTRAPTKNKIGEEASTRAEDKIDEETTLADPEFRACFINDLFELRSFFMQRLVELSNTTPYSKVDPLSMFPKSISKISSTQVSTYLSAINKCLDLINSKDTRRLLAIWNDKTGVLLQRVVDELQHRIIVRERGRGAIIANDKRVEEKRRELLEVMEKLEKVKMEMKMVKKETEEMIGELFGGKRVCLLGQINLFITK